VITKSPNTRSLRGCFGGCSVNELYHLVFRVLISSYVPCKVTRICGNDCFHACKETRAPKD